MRFLLFSIVMCVACASDYKGLRAIKADDTCIARLKPKPLSTSWYTATVDVIGKHMSGLVVLKNMPDKSDRIVFMNEAGLSFFDFEFDSLHRLKVKQVIRQLDKKPVIKVLKHDFELMMGFPFAGNLAAWQMNGQLYIGTKSGKTMDFFVTSNDCKTVDRLESGSPRRKMVTIQSWGEAQMPDSLHIQHYTFAMKIALRKLEKK